MKYDFAAIEKKWQKRWEETKPYAAVTGDKRPKFYGLIEFPYPSGQGLHVGHPRSYTALDIVARKGDFVHFVEVKTRTNLSCGLPREYVTPQKQQRLRKTAAWYLMVKDLDCPARFDVAEVYADGPHPQKAARIEYIENAF